jgi:hypothetical protein
VGGGTRARPVILMQRTRWAQSAERGARREVRAPETNKNLSAGEPLANVAHAGRVQRMKAQFTYWKESDGKYLGYLNSYPNHWTQGDDLEDLKAHLRDLHETFSSGDIPGIRMVGELEVA